MSWLRKLLGLDQGSPASAPAPARANPELTEGKRRLSGHLSDADKAIRAAMSEVDNTFGYRGPERRHHPR